MTYSLPEIAALFAGIVAVIAAIGAAVANVIMALRTSAKVAAVEAKTDGLVHAVQEVHNLTNSGLSAVKAELVMANALNAQLLETIRDLKSEREKNARAAANAHPHAAI